MGPELEERNAAAQAASDLLGVDHLAISAFPDNQMDTTPLLEVIKRIEAIVADVCPERVYTHHHNCLNVDHQIVSRAVVTACRPQVACTVKDIFFFEVPSSTEWSQARGQGSFQPTYFEDITDYLDDKLDALDCYSSEMRPWPHPRSFKGVRALAEWRGATVGVDAAEAFEVYRIVR